MGMVNEKGMRELALKSSAVGCLSCSSEALSHDEGKYLPHAAALLMELVVAGVHQLELGEISSGPLHLILPQLLTLLGSAWTLHQGSLQG